MIVVDTNVICYRWMSSANSAAAEIALAKDPLWIAPLLWRSEFRDIVGLAIRRKALADRQILREFPDAAISLDKFVRE